MLELAKGTFVTSLDLPHICQYLQVLRKPATEHFTVRATVLVLQHNYKFDTKSLRCLVSAMNTLVLDSLSTKRKLQRKLKPNVT